MAPVWVFWAFAGAGALLAAYTLLRALSARRRAPVVTPECTPPDGVSSAEVGYIIDNSADAYNEQARAAQKKLSGFPASLIAGLTGAQAEEFSA